MEKLLSNFLVGMGSLLEACNHILEEKIPKDDLEGLLAQIDIMVAQSESYMANLQNQGTNSRSSISREIASLILNEDKKLRALIEKDFPEPGKHESAKGPEDLNVGVLYEEYLTGRAMQAVREALIGAVNLKMLQEKDAGKAS